MKSKIDWDAMKRHIDSIFNVVKLSLEDVDDIGPWVADVLLENYPPRIEAVYLRRSQDKRRAESYNGFGYWESNPPEDEVIKVAEKVALAADTYDLSAKRGRRSSGLLNYTLKAKYEQFEVES